MGRGDGSRVPRIYLFRGDKKRDKLIAYLNCSALVLKLHIHGTSKP